MKVMIDPRAGFCGGVKRVVKIAERELAASETPLLSLGDVSEKSAGSKSLVCVRRTIQSLKINPTLPADFSFARMANHRMFSSARMRADSRSLTAPARS